MTTVSAPRRVVLGWLVLAAHACQPGTLPAAAPPPRAAQRPVRIGLAPGVSPFRVAVAADGRTVTTVDGQAARLWDVASAKQLRQVAIHRHAFWGYVTLSRDGTTVAFPVRGEGGWDHTVEVWDVVAGTRRCALALPDPHGQSGLSLSPDGTKLVSRDWLERSLRLWDTTTGKQVGTILEPLEAELAAWKAKGLGVSLGNFGEQQLGDRTLVTFWQIFRPGKPRDVSDFEAYLADPLAGTPFATIHFPANSYVNSCALSRDERSLVTLLRVRGRPGAGGKRNEPDEIRLASWETASGQERWGQPAEVGVGVAISPDDRTVAVGGVSGVIRLLTAGAGTEVGRLQAEGSPLGLAFSADGRRLVATGRGGVLLWDVARWTGRPADPAGPAAGTLAPARQEALWADLAGDVKPARQAVLSLLAAPGPAVRLLRDRLRPVEDNSEKEARKWLADLDSDSFALREKAERELRRLGARVVPLLDKTRAAAPSKEVARRLGRISRGIRQETMSRTWSPEEVRQVRAVEVLEQVGNAEARQVLATLAKGSVSARLTREARSALDRLLARPKR